MSNEQIIVLSDKEKARNKIGVWHGSASNWINMVKELSGNSLDIFKKLNNNKTNKIKIIIHNNNKIEYIDSGTGIPVESVASDGRPNYEAIFEIPFAAINSSKSIGYILIIDKYPTGADEIPLSSTPNKDPLIAYLKLPSSTRNFIFVTISGHF